MSHEMELDIGVAYLRLIPYSEAIALKYHYDCPTCEVNEVEYNSLIPIQKSGTIGIQPYKEGQPYGDSIYIPVVQHEAVDAEVTYRSEYSDWYTAGGENGLVDGKIGTLNFRDGSWQGFWGSDLECTVQLYAPAEISSVTAHFYQYNNSWIFIPTEMSVDVSSDGTNWESWGTTKSENDPKQRGKYIMPITITAETPERVTFIRLTAKNLGVVPDWHEAAGSDAWIFIDEIIVE
jgi:hexosaminidase